MTKTVRAACVMGWPANDIRVVANDALLADNPALAKLFEVMSIPLEDIFAQHLAHKTVLSIIAWAVFAILLWGRHRLGWRGRTAIGWTVAGFVLLILGYFGSKFVLQIVLHRV